MSWVTTCLRFTADDEASLASKSLGSADPAVRSGSHFGVVAEGTAALILQSARPEFRQHLETIRTAKAAQQVNRHSSHMPVSSALPVVAAAAASSHPAPHTLDKPEADEIAEPEWMSQEFLGEFGEGEFGGRGAGGDENQDDIAVPQSGRRPLSPGRDGTP